MKLGLYFAVFNHLEISTAMKQAAALGIEGIEISAHVGGKFDVDEMLRKNCWRTIKKMAADFGMAITAINMSADGQLVLGPHHSDTDRIFAGTPEEKVRFGTTRMLQAARLAHLLEVPVVTG